MARMRETLRHGLLLAGSAWFMITLTSAGFFTPEGIKAQIEKYRIVPDVLSEAPKEEVQVIFPGDVTVQMGNFIHLNRTSQQPNITWPASNSSFYTLIMVDADFTSRMVATDVEYQHWMIFNIPGTNLSQGEEVTEWKAPKPTKSHAYHRFVFIVYEHNFTHFRELRVRGGQLEIYRENFKTSKFAEKYNLGGAHAINFFRASQPTEE